MTEIATFDGFGQRFRFEPPVEIGSHIVDSLGKLAAIASKGPDAHPLYIDAMAQHTDAALSTLYPISGTTRFPELISQAASVAGNVYKVSVE